MCCLCRIDNDDGSACYLEVDDVRVYSSEGTTSLSQGRPRCAGQNGEHCNEARTVLFRPFCELHPFL